MNILHISPYFPSLETNHAGGVCMGKEIETLRKWHNVYVLTFAASEFDKKLAQKYRNDSRYQTVAINKWSRGLHVLLEPFFPNYFAVRSSVRFSIKLIWCIKKHHIDEIHAEYAAMGQYLWIKKIYPHIKFNLVEHDVTVQSYERKLNAASGWKKRYLSFQTKRIFIYEKKYCQQVNALFSLNWKDKDLIERYFGRADTYVFNPFYGIEDKEIEEGAESGKLPEYAAVCFMGQMGRDENYLAAMRLIQLGRKLKEKIPELQIYIVGNNPPKDLKSQECDYVHVTGFVEDVDIYLKKSQIAVFPLTLGAGIKLKVLRSLALGTPVITGKLGAEGIDVEGQVIVLAETDEEYLEKMYRLIIDPEKCDSLSKKSREYIIEYFGWKKSEEALSTVYNH